MSNDIKFSGFIIMNAGRGIQPIEVRRDGEYISIWIGDELADDIPATAGWYTYLADEYGNKFILELNDFNDKELSIADLLNYVNA